MAQAKALDTAYLKAQDPEQHASLAIGAVAIVDGPAPDPTLLKALLVERFRSIPRCTQLLRAQDFEWIDCPGFDVARHVRRVAIPRPGDDTQLSQAIAFALERPLDLNRPPWECWVIEGLTGNRWAILIKTHHDVADGNSAAHLLTRLCDDAGEAAVAKDLAATQVSSAPRPGWIDALGRAAALAGTLVGAMWPAERLPVDPVMRRYGTVRVPAADVDKVCRKFGVTVNDVALAAITEGFRRVLLRRGEEPRADSLRTLVPLWGAPVRSAMLPYLPVEHEDPVQQLRTVHNRWKVQKREPGIVESALNCLPALVRSNVLQLLARLPHAGVVTLGTHTPGPRHQLRLMGRTIERLLPIPPTAVRLSTGVAVLSYGDDVVFGITAEYDSAADVKELVAGIELGMARMVALSGDSVLLFGKDHRRRRAARRHPSQAYRAHPSARY
ncbi:diacylglycerol O-acyltransferase [Mycobacterium sp. 852002-50816_SCH5313054-b]|uniref:wax ester/triacylglycerol synthase domain-containing protein n=1 Tax=Mycobacterium sp. 852002-50816_SCH5313054-b TaxID=1834092 RepID=UPI0007FC2BFD|nr:wax ester/triacylglycerol synthase domain-containing protein [Mycobacterium sp. 852002-50816_SCH5313054-b]OBF60202.1 diacylglycerol O-acyltransferase [Mycobacterium sp. 852002-50816_SCH5313054-b]